MDMIGNNGTSSESAGVLHTQTIKAHITTAVTGVSTGSWTDFTGFTVIASESNGDSVSLDGDTKTFKITREGLYQFGGCVHYDNDTPSGFSDLTVLTRIYVNATTEARCSQRGVVIENFGANDEQVISYNGTAYLEAGDELTLQYYTNESDLEFFANSNFDNPVAATLWLNYIGTY